MIINIFPGKTSPYEGSNSEGDREDDINATKEELEKRKALAQKVNEEYEIMVKLLKEQEAFFKETQYSLQK